MCYSQGLYVECFFKNHFLLSWQFVSLSSTNIADYRFDVKRELWCEFTLQVRANLLNDSLIVHRIWLDFRLLSNEKRK